MQPYSSNSSISNANIMGANGDGYSDLVDQILQPVYIETPMLEPWMTSSPEQQQQQQQQSNYQQMYSNNNSSFLSTPPPMISASAAPCIPTMINNSSFPPPLVGGSASSPSSATTMTPPPHATTSFRSNNFISNNYMAPRGNEFAATATPQLQQHAHTSYYSHKRDFSPSPSPPTHYRNNSIGSESSLEFLDDQHTQTSSSSNSKQDSGSKSTSVKKREKALERNRQAALRCRQRKKEWLNQLQSNVDTLTKENRALEQQSISLREEILNLKTVLLAHRDCSHAHITAASINMDNLLYQTTTSPPLPVSQAPPAPL